MKTHLNFHYHLKFLPSGNIFLALDSLDYDLRLCGCFRKDFRKPPVALMARGFVSDKVAALAQENALDLREGTPTAAKRLLEKSYCNKTL